MNNETKNPDPPTPEAIVETAIYTVAEAARLAKVSETTIARACNAGLIEHGRAGTGKEKSPIRITGRALLVWLSGGMKSKPETTKRKRRKSPETTARRFIKTR